MEIPEMQPLPSYRKPPVNEVICGIRFRQSEKLFIPHFGCLWKKFKSDYPNIEHAHPISIRPGELILDTATGLPIPRVWFINQAGDQLIQFQVDRFYYNWRRREDAYPRYRHVISRFNDVVEKVKEFFNDLELGEFTPLEYELTYINHIHMENNVDTDSMPKIFKDFIWNSSAHKFLPAPEILSWQSEFQLPENKGRMLVSLKKAIRKNDGAPLFVFEFKVLGIDETNNVQQWFDTAREWIVNGFTDMTTEEIHKIWERE